MRARATGLGLAILAFAAFTAADLLVFRGLSELDRLRSRNDGEQTMNALFTSLRDHADFGSAIEASPELGKRIVGIGVYGSGKRIYSWGSVPQAYESPSGGRREGQSPVREYLENPKSGSLVLILWAPDSRPPPPEDPEGQRGREAGGQGEGDAARSFMRDTMRGSDVIYLEIRQPDYWRRRRAYAFLFIAAWAAAAALTLFVRRLMARNAEYGRLLEEQRNLVILGTAAGTLAHEIKNPLLAIRLQTGILARTCPPSASRELGIIDEEVERLSSLAHRVNDYLRDPAGRPARLSPAQVLRETGKRLCGRDIVAGEGGEGAETLIDPDRLRSILENLLRNALESGGPAEGVSAEVAIVEGAIAIDVLDRGRGIAAADRERAFDPFFTTKGRGTGIGLAISKRFAEAAGGSISLEGRPGGGARARLSLPLAPAQGAEP